jgi:hypothetical protein
MIIAMVVMVSAMPAAVIIMMVPMVVMIPISRENNASGYREQSHDAD